MDKKDRDFLVRSQAVSERYEARLDELTAKIQPLQKQCMNAEQPSLSAYRRLLDLSIRLDRLFDAYLAHWDRIDRLTDQLREERALNALVTDANRLAGTDGDNFFTKAGKVIDEQAE